MQPAVRPHLSIPRCLPAFRSPEANPGASDAPRVASGLLVLLVALTAGAGPAEAVPYFSRRYETSCKTCHATAPTLNSFGEAFRRLGYRFPGNQEEIMSKEKLVPLGTEGTKRVHPDETWPTDISAIPPVSAYIGQQLEGRRSRVEDTFSFDGLGEIAGLYVTGNLDDSYTYWTEFEVAFGGIQIPQGFFGIRRPFGRKIAVDAKLGKFIPTLMEVTNKRRLTNALFAVLQPNIDGGGVVGDNAVNLEPSQKGAELYGFLGQDTGWNLGVVAGQTNVFDPATGRSNAASNHKDWYAHVNHKLIGDSVLGNHLDGTPATTVAVSMRPGHNLWGDAESITVGAFVYGGSASLDAATEQQDDFVIFGGDAALYRDNLRVHAAATRRDHDSPVLGDSRGRVADTWHLQGDYALFPWLWASVRFEEFDHEELAGDTLSRDYRRWVPNLKYQPRQNLHFTLGAEVTDRSALAGGFDVDRVLLSSFLNF